MEHDPLAERSQHLSPTCTGLRFSLAWRLLRVLVGAAAILAVGAYVEHIHADLRHDLRMYYASGTEFVVTALFSATVGYLLCRCFFGHFAGLLTGMASAGITGSLFLWSKGDDMREFAILGMVVACALFVGIGWLDRSRTPFLKKTRGEVGVIRDA